MFLIFSDFPMKKLNIEYQKMILDYKFSFRNNMILDKKFIFSKGNQQNIFLNSDRINSQKIYFYFYFSNFLGIR